MKASIIIPVWAFNDHALDLARATARNIWQTTPEGDYELIMVYAGVDPAGLGNRVDRFIRIDPPQGWAAASNIGLLAATGTHLIVGSIDIRVPEGWLDPLIDAAGTTTVTSPYDYKADGKTRRNWDTHHRGSFWGGWFCFHRDILTTVGFLDGYAMRGKADMDWAIRARQAGMSTVRVPVKAMHIEPHHTLNAHPDPYTPIVRQLFRARHGLDRFGEYEGLDWIEGQ